MDEKIICAAVQFYILNDNQIKIMRVHRHSDFYKNINELNIKLDKARITQGFIAYNINTKKERFVNRYEAARIVKMNHQPTTEYYDGRFDELFSVDLW